MEKEWGGLAKAIVRIRLKRIGSLCHGKIGNTQSTAKLDSLYINGDDVVKKVKKCRVTFYGGGGKYIIISWYRAPFVPKYHISLFKDT